MAQSEFSQPSRPFLRQPAVAADLFRFTLVPQRLVRNWPSQFFQVSVFGTKSNLGKKKSPLVVSKACFSHAKAEPLTTSEVGVFVSSRFRLLFTGGGGI